MLQLQLTISDCHVIFKGKWNEFFNLILLHGILLVHQCYNDKTVNLFGQMVTILNLWDPTEYPKLQIYIYAF